MKHTDECECPECKSRAPELVAEGYQTKTMYCRVVGVFYTEAHRWRVSFDKYRKGDNHPYGRDAWGIDYWNRQCIKWGSND